MRRVPTTPSSGFTLIEAMVALFLMTIMLGAAMGLVSWMVRANAFSGRMTTAVSLGRDKIEELVEGSASDIASGTDAMSIYHRTWRVESDSYKKTILVTVSWFSLEGHRRQANLNTMVDL